jgi:hypothetical protein
MSKLRLHSKFLTVTVLAVVVAVTIIFIYIRHAHAAATIQVSINNGAAVFTLAKSQSDTDHCHDFSLVTHSTSAAKFGYSLAASADAPTGISITKKSDSAGTGVADGSTISDDRETPTTVITTTSAASDDVTTTYTACVTDSATADGNYDVNLSYNLSENDLNRGFLGDMQSSTICDKLVGLNDYGTTRDTRDGTIYTVRRLADGQCWMVDNLRLSLASGLTLTSANSDVSGTIAVPPTAVSTAAMTSNGNDPGSDSTADSDVWAWVNPGTVTNSSYCAPGKDLATCGGYMYNYYTATAGSTTVGASTTTAAHSICPAGWRLPAQTGTDGNLTAKAGDFVTLAKDLSADDLKPTGVFENAVVGWWYNYGNGWNFNLDRIPIRTIFATSGDTYGGSVSRHFEVNLNGNTGSGIFVKWGGDAIRCILR